MIKVNLPIFTIKPILSFPESIKQFTAIGWLSLIDISHQGISYAIIKDNK